MRRLSLLLLLSSLALSGIPAHAQQSQVDPSGDFGVNDLPGTAPTVGAPGGPSVPANPTLFRDFAARKVPTGF